MQISFGNDFIFKLDTLLFDQIQRQSPQRWSTHERVGERPALQNLGPGVETTSLPGAIFDCWLGLGDMKSIDALYAIKESGVPRELWHMVEKEERYRLGFWTGSKTIIVSAAERYLPGTWVITDISENKSNFKSTGEPRKIEWTLSLSRYD